MSNGVPVAQDDLESHSLPDFATMALIQSVTDDNQLIKVKENVIGLNLTTKSGQTKYHKCCSSYEQQFFLWVFGSEK